MITKTSQNKHPCSGGECRQGEPRAGKQSDAPSSSEAKSGTNLSGNSAAEIEAAKSEMGTAAIRAWEKNHNRTIYRPKSVGAAYRPTVSRTGSKSDYFTPYTAVILAFAVVSIISVILAWGYEHPQRRLVTQGFTPPVSENTATENIAAKNHQSGSRNTGQPQPSAIVNLAPDAFPPNAPPGIQVSSNQEPGGASDLTAEALRQSPVDKAEEANVSVETLKQLLAKLKAVQNDRQDIQDRQNESISGETYSHKLRMYTLEAKDIAADANETSTIANDYSSVGDSTPIDNLAREPTYGTDRYFSNKAGVHIVVHFNPKYNEEAAQKVEEQLRMGGYENTTLRPVSLNIRTSNMRYFHDEDLENALDVIDHLKIENEEPELRDFTHFEPPPLPGVLEVWMSKNWQ